MKNFNPTHVGTISAARSDSHGKPLFRDQQVYLMSDGPIFVQENGTKWNKGSGNPVVTTEERPYRVLKDVKEINVKYVVPIPA